MMKHLLSSGLVLGALLVATGAQAGTITTYNNRAAFDLAVGPTTTDTFGLCCVIPISTGVLDSINPPGAGRVQPGVAYSTPIGTGNFFNVDAGGGFPTAFLDGGIGNFSPLTVTFTNPIAAFGFDTNPLMGSAFDITMNFSADPSVVQNHAVPGGFNSLSFFGFQSSAADITSLRIVGDGQQGFTFALDNFSVGGNPGGNGHNVPEPASLLLLGSGIIGLGVWSRRRVR